MVPHETRNIAGFNCRKAYTILFDSVYVFAFYTDEIMISGGPLGIHGLPGMILGITIPRMHTSWIATKLQINGVDTSIIKPPKKGEVFQPRHPQIQPRLFGQHANSVAHLLRLCHHVITIDPRRAVAGAQNSP